MITGIYYFCRCSVRHLFWKLQGKQNNRSCSVKTDALKDSENSQETPVPEFFLWQNCRPLACNFIKKETSTQVFTCNFAKSLRIPFFTEHLWVTASVESFLSKHFQAIAAEQWKIIPSWIVSIFNVWPPVSKLSSQFLVQ